jgi:hypothetical protein
MITTNEARSILGSSVNDWTSQEVDKHIITMELLVDAWIDIYERSIFNGKTVKQLITQRGGKEVSYI